MNLLDVVILAAGKGMRMKVERLALSVSRENLFLVR